jgi:hypothetical protein
MLNKNQEEIEQKRNEIMERLNQVGIRVTKGKKIPVKGRYSGIVGHRGKVLKLNIPDVFNY